MKIKKILPLIGIAIFIYLIYRVGLTNILSTLVKANIFYLIMGTGFIFVAVTALAFKWNLILRRQNIKLNFLYVIKIYFIGVFYGTITPARAGSLIRASYLKEKLNISLVKGASSIVIERLMDLFVLFLLSILGGFLLAKYIPGLLYKMIIAFIIFVILCSILFIKKGMEFVLKFVCRFLIPKRFDGLKNKAKDSFHIFYDNVPKLKKLIVPLIVTFLVWVVVQSQAYIFAKAFNINVPFISFITIFCITTVIGTIPITVGGLGTREATLIFLLAIFGISADKVMSMSIALVIVGTCIPGLIGFLLSVKEGKKKNEIFDNNSPSTI